MINNLFKTYGNRKVIKYKKVGALDFEIFEVENSPEILKNTIKDLFDNYEIEDLQVENIQLEEIIEQFYK